MGPEQSPTNHTCYGIYFPAILRCYQSIEVNSTWIFFWISKRLISFAWDLLAFNMENICISTIYDGTFVNANG